MAFPGRGWVVVLALWAAGGCASGGNPGAGSPDLDRPAEIPTETRVEGREGIAGRAVVADTLGAQVAPGSPGESLLPVWEPVFNQELRATVGTFPPIEGRARAISGDVLLLQQEDRSYPLRIGSIRRLEVRRFRRSRAVEGGLVGALAGAVLGRLTLAGIGGEHWESQGRLLAPGLGAIMGGLLGALVGRQFAGDYWEVVRIPASPTLAPGRRIVEPLTARDSRSSANRRNHPSGASRW